MSVNKWNWREECDTRVCCGDCDGCIYSGVYAAGSWQSPIDVIVSEVQAKLEEEVMSACQKVGIVVDKDELVKALNYDRQQYEKGFSDGLRSRVLVSSGEWTPIKKRPMTDEEREYFDNICDWIVVPEDQKFMFDCEMPKNEQDVLLCDEWGNVFIDTICVDDMGSYPEKNEDWDDIIAWMPLPEPYRREE